MDSERIQLKLDSEKRDLIIEVSELQKQIGESELKKTKNNLFDAIQSNAIETITMALGVSDILESTDFKMNGVCFDQEYQEFQKWKSMPLDSRTKEYKTKFVSPREFRKLISSTEDLVYNRNELTGKEYKNAVKTQRSNNPEGYDCAYTGKRLKHGDSYHYDHVQSTHEISQDPVLNYTTTIEERRKFANSNDNLVPIDARLNQALSNKKVKDIEKWGNQKSKNNPSITNNEEFQINSEKIRKAQEKSENGRSELIKSKVVEKDLIGKFGMSAENALKSGAKAAIGRLLSITIVEIVNVYRKEDSLSLKRKIEKVAKNVKNKSQDIIKSFGDHAVSSFLSTFLQIILESLFKIAKNLFKFIKTAIVSILKALKTLFSKNSSPEDREREALRILGLALTTMVGLALEEVIEKTLIASFPIVAPIAPFISPVLSGLVVGIGSVLVLHGFQQYQSKIEFIELNDKMKGLNWKASNLSIAQASLSNSNSAQAIKVSFQLFENSFAFFDTFNNHANAQIESTRQNNLLIDMVKKEADELNLENEELIKILKNQ